MKRHISFILFISLSLHSVSALHGMQKTIEFENENTEEVHANQEGANQVVAKLSDLPDEVLFEIFGYLGDKRFLDSGTSRLTRNCYQTYVNEWGNPIKNARLVNKCWKELIDRRVFKIVLKDFEHGIIKRLQGSSGLDYEKIKELEKILENELRKFNVLILSYKCYKRKDGDDRGFFLKKENLKYALCKAFNWHIKPMGLTYGNHNEGVNTSWFTEIGDVIELCFRAIDPQFSTHSFWRGFAFVVPYLFVFLCAIIFSFSEKILKCCNIIVDVTKEKEKLKKIYGEQELRIKKER